MRLLVPPPRFLASVRKLHLSASRSCSALFVTSLRAAETTAVLQPHLDYKNKLKDPEKLRKMLATRGLRDVDVEKMKETLEFIESIKATKQTLEQRRVATSKELTELYKNEAENEKVIKPLRAVSVMLRDNLKSINKEIAGLEENVVLKFLSLPNDFHPQTPPENKVIHESSPPELHPELLNFISATPDRRDGAKVLLEMFLSRTCFERFSGYVKSSNCDFVKSLVVEGAGMKHRDPKAVFVLQAEGSESEDARLHLVGGASLPSFCALFAKTLTPADSLPVKLVAVGRNYLPQGDQVPAAECQSTVAQLFAVSENNPEVENGVYGEILEDAQAFYDSIKVRYRFVAKCGAELENWESLCTSIEVFSEAAQDFVPVGRVSLCGTFISNRLLMKYKKGKSTDFLSVVTGTIVDFKKLENCLGKTVNV